MFDVIGDIHGERRVLEALLTELGYRNGPSGWRHPDRLALFVGDLIDRGPDAPGVVDLVREMCGNGAAECILGNHELNALAFHTEDPDRPGEYLRPHTTAKVKQHQETLNQYGRRDGALADALEWFKTLPFWIERDGIRIVHAAWHPHSVRTLEPLLNERRALRDHDALVQIHRQGTAPADAVETLLKGVEHPLPDGHRFRDKDGHERTEARIRWWMTGVERSWRELAIGPPDLIEQLPDITASLPAEYGYPADAAPVFVGHYWMTGTPKPLTDNVACVDYSVVQPGGKLVAYRWSGEGKLTADGFVAVQK